MSVHRIAAIPDKFKKRKGHGPTGAAANQIAEGSSYKNSLGSVFMVRKICGNGRIECVAVHNGVQVTFSRKQMARWILV